MEGWKCPGCEKCFAPSVTECHYCGQDQTTVVGVGIAVEPYGQFDLTKSSGTDHRFGPDRYTSVTKPSDPTIKVMQ